MPAFRALRAAYPAAHITLIGLPWSEDFVQRYSRYLDDFIEFPGWPGLPERVLNIERIPAFLQQVQSRHFDLAIQMQGDGSIVNPLVELFGAKHTAGFYPPGQYYPQGQLFFPYPDGLHEIHIFLRLVEEMGIPAQGDALEFPLTGADRQAFDVFRQQHSLSPGGYACLHPGARMHNRRVSPETFAAVGDALAQDGLKIVLTGTTAECHLAQAVAEHMRSPVIDACGQTDLGLLGMIVKNARILVSNDTGVSHVAAACGAPSVVLFTFSDPKRWRPLDHQLHRAVFNAQSAAPAEILAVARSLLNEEVFYADRPI